MVKTFQDLGAQWQTCIGGGMLVVFRIDMHHHIGDIAHVTHERYAHHLADLVALRDADGPVHEDMDVDKRHAPRRDAYATDVRCEHRRSTG